tara:strand:- start:106 stop:462 length:357 start_codon:yes stop_codon:yes gene_type:complete
LLSGVDEAGWETIPESKFEKGWVGETGAICEWTCLSGDGPIDACRVRLVVYGNIEKVFDSIVDVKLKTRGTIEHPWRGGLGSRLLLHISTKMTRLPLRQFLKAKHFGTPHLNEEHNAE